MYLLAILIITANKKTKTQEKIKQLCEEVKIFNYPENNFLITQHIKKKKKNLK